MRNRTYTLYKGIQVELGRDMSNNFKLIYRGSSCPFTDFVKFFSLDANGSEVFSKVIYHNEEITNAFSVTTYALYKGFKFQVSNKKNEIFQLTTGDENAYRQLDLEFIDRGYYLKWVHKSDIEKMWEERKKAGYDLPMPEGIKEVQEIDF